MRLFSFIVLLVLSASTAYCMSLDEMQDAALEKRELVKRFMINLEKSERDIGLARSGYYPSVDLSYQTNTLDEDATFEAEENSVLYGAVTWNLFRGFRDKYQIQSAELFNEVEDHQLNGIKQDIRLDVALRYLDVYERRANLEVAKKNYETLDKIYRDGENRLDVGLIDRNELLKFKVDLNNSIITTEAARAGLEKSVNNLGRTIGESVQLGSLDFGEFKDIPENEEYENSERLMLENRSELLALRKLVDASLYQVKVEESDYYPKVGVVGSYRKYDDDYLNGNGNVEDDELRAQLVLSINLFQGLFTEESVAKARLENRGLQYDLDELTDTFKNELKNLHIDYAVSLRNVNVALISIEQAEENLRITRLKYDEGLQRESDLLDAVTNLSRAQYDYVAVVRTVFLNRFRILRMIEAI